MTYYDVIHRAWSRRDGEWEVKCKHPHTNPWVVIESDSDFWLRPLGEMRECKNCFPSTWERHQFLSPRIIWLVREAHRRNGVPWKAFFASDFEEWLAANPDYSPGY